MDSTTRAWWVVVAIADVLFFRRLRNRNRR
jgi:hypothetical protein